MQTIKRLALASALAAFSSPTAAGGNGFHGVERVEVGAHQPTVADVVADALGLPSYVGAPVGTPANPAPVCPPAVVYRVQRGPLTNAPPSPTDTYRVISDCN